MANKIFEFAKNRVVRQTFLLYFGFLFFGASVFVGNTLLARQLSPDDYGAYQLIIAIVTFMAFFFDFGLSSTGARILAIEKDGEEERKSFSNLFYAFLVVCLLFLIVLFLAKWVIASVYSAQIAADFYMVIVFACTYPFFYFFPSVFQGMNRIAFSALYYFLQGAFFLILAFSLSKNITSGKAGLIFYGAFFGATLLVAFMARPALWHVSSKKINFILSENKRYGLHVYLGNIVERTSFHLDKLMIAFFVDSSHVAFYSLGLMLIAVMTTFSMALNQSLFKIFASSNKVDSKVFFYNYLWVFVASLTLFLFHKPLILLIFGQQYLAVTSIIVPLVLAGACQSLYQPYQAYLASKGVKEIKNGSYISALVNVVFNFALIPYFGYLGAAFATFLSYFTWYIFLRHLYLKTINV